SYRFLKHKIDITISLEISNRVLCKQSTRIFNGGEEEAYCIFTRCTVHPALEIKAKCPATSVGLVCEQVGTFSQYTQLTRKQVAENSPRYCLTTPSRLESY